MKTKHKIIFALLLSTGFVFLVVFLGFPVLVIKTGQNYTFADVDSVESTRVAIIFGAGVKRDGTPSDALKDRLIAGQELYEANKVEKILVSGDNRFETYNEPDAMRNFLIEQGIPEDDVIADYAGRRTYDTCVRAAEIFQVSEAILVTQGYHLSRAIWTCDQLGVESRGVSATKRQYVYDDRNKTREVLAIYSMFIDLYLWGPDYIGGEVEAIE